MSHRGFRDQRHRLEDESQEGQGMPSAFAPPQGDYVPVPVFTQAHVEYLLQAFKADVTREVQPDATAETVHAYVSKLRGRLEVIKHIQSLVDNQKGTGR